MAAFALLLISLAPTILHALQGRAGIGWTEVCTTVGARWVGTSAEAHESAPLPAPSPVFDHCPYCSLQAGGALGPPPALIVMAMLPVGDELPRLFLVAPRTLPVWLAAQARAPPRLF